MTAAPLRFLTAAAWPLTIWTSLSHFEEHAADDYVERTSPIVATAIAFWACVGALVVVAYFGGSIDVFADDGSVSVVPRWAGDVSGVLWFFVPVIYIVGLWLYTSREEAFPR